MDKRIHKKPSTNLTYRHYLFHFKWPLLGFIFLLIFLYLTQMNFSSYIYSSDELEDNIDILLTDVIYPTDIFNKKTRNKSISYYFTRKDQLKAIDDKTSIEK